MKHSTSRENAPSSRFPPKGAFVGMATVDLIYFLGTRPGRNSKVASRRLELCAGGPACNAAAAFASLGGSALLFSPVGSHPISSVIRDDLSRFALKIIDLAPGYGGVPTLASGFVAVDTGERTVVAALPEGVRATPIDPSLVDGSSVVLCDGYWLEAAVTAASRAHAQGVPVVLDGGSWKPGLEELLPSTGVAICSQDFLPPGCRDAPEARDFLRARGVDRVAWTRGEKSVLYSDQGREGEIAVSPTHAVDTLGAGDVFHGAFCLYFALRADFVAALDFAARAATLKCATAGTRAWMESEEAAGLRSIVASL